MSLALNTIRLAGRSADTLATLRNAVHTHRVDAAARRELEHELASYTCPGDIEDLLAMVDGQSSHTAAQMRDILQRKLSDRYYAAPRLG